MGYLRRVTPSKEKRCAEAVVGLEAAKLGPSAPLGLESVADDVSSC